MKYDLIEMIITIFDIFNNPVGITAVVVALLIGILMCIYGNVNRDDDGTLIGYYEKHEYRNRETVGLYQPKR